MSQASSATPTPTIARKLLEIFYPRVDTLLVYISSTVTGFVLSENQDNRDGGATPEGLKALLSSTLVGWDEQHNNTVFASRVPEMELEEVIDHAQLMVFKESRSKVNNVLCFGYRQAEWRNEPGKIGAQRGAIANFFTNTMVTALQSPAWRLLLRLIGEQPMMHLLARTSVFLALPGDQDCFAQATGTIVTDLLPLAGKQLKSGAGKTQSMRSLVDISFIRARMFYGRPRFSRKGNIRLGLPAKHLLNRILDTLPEPNNESRQRMEAATRHVAKHIFPLQYGLHNVFTCTLSYWENGGHFRDYEDREAEIEDRGSQKTPDRLKKVLPLIESLIRRHERFNYQRVCASTCKSRLDSPSSSSLDQTRILELMSEYSQSIIANFPMSQIPDKSYQVSHPSLVIPHGASEAALETKLKPRFVEFACSHHEVLRYIKTVVDEVIPHAFWGSVANRRVIDSHIEKVVTQRRFETLTLHTLMQRLCVADCEWLGETKDQRVCQSDALKRAELLREFIYWFFDSFVMPLIRTSFYVTETSALQHQLLYFRHDDWQTLCIPLLDKLSGETFERIDPSELEPSRRLGISHVRLLPKETGVRPIVNLGRKARVKQDKIPGMRQHASSKDEPSRPSVNQVLNAAFNILNYEKVNMPIISAHKCSMCPGLSRHKSQRCWEHLFLGRMTYTENCWHSSLVCCSPTGQCLSCILSSWTFAPASTPSSRVSYSTY
ncbi:hypothetical protein FRC08_003803 [Ceratobasidium sp. 394]|nr:hypothetical protein FRC08_003803 [Ceratobasidium sp. 394]